MEQQPRVRDRGLLPLACAAAIGMFGLFGPIVLWDAADSPWPMVFVVVPLAVVVACLAIGWRWLHRW
jgi:NhaP-type Na+/H+ or K+/H+ antiporter